MLIFLPPFANEWNDVANKHQQKRQYERKKILLQNNNGVEEKLFEWIEALRGEVLKYHPSTTAILNHEHLQRSG